MKITHILIAILLLTAMTIIGSIASDQEWIITTKEEQSSHSKYLDPNTADVKVSFEEAKNILNSKNTDLKADSINGKLINDSDFGIIWRLTSKTSNDESIIVGIDADDGNILFIYDDSKETRADNKISKEEAIKNAEKYMENELSDEQQKEVQFETAFYLEPVADDLPGSYHVSYDRMINGIASLSDGIVIMVNAETGYVTSYTELWNMPEEDTYVVNKEVILTEKEAAEYLKQFIGNEAYDGKVSSTTEVIKSKLVWKYTGKNEIRLAWWMQFTDPKLGLDGSLPGLVCIDANTGEVLIADYIIG
ncbi:YcdB/YcdC domain-containing protein [Methanolobus profundi]|uniref:YcdB/YcdC repeated domain-containing protein n=1 Tax=Methanolobus profundi TaxID=487685 RepID=A0A1I4UMK8_9EURY|nr:YcdB/YcdC domain-containing protein [Methanolobus profundi]SFM90151.1 hypothetical protein SAMN04488696_2791 [Methanolobus profundi]